MRGQAAVAGALLLAACGGGSDEATQNDGAIAAAPEPVPSAGAPTPVTPATTLPAGDGIPGVSAPPPLDPPGPVPDPSASVAVEAGADAAVAVLRAYFAAIADRRYGDAYRLWQGRGQAAGMGAQAFADSYAKYRSYTATIGTPGPIDAGAGQRYIEIPVTVDARLSNGRPARLEGPVTLHRAGDIDGATPEQRSWRISASGLKPRPAGDTPGQ